MNPMKRRSFLKRAGTAGALATAWASPAVQAAGALERINVGVIGCSRGRRLAPEFTAAGEKLMYVCDPDEARVRRLHKESGAEHAVADLRRVLDDPAVDAVAIATPDHWHGPAAILACEAGKHVYVEKPCSHNIREGRLMIEAARRTKRVMQVGSQSRSLPVLAGGIQAIREGAIGTVLAAKAWNSQRRRTIGHAEPSEPPAGFDYDLWVGPAPMRPFRSTCHHYSWHWWYDFGSGDAGNDGVHELDIATWGLGVETHPTIAAGHGSKLFFDDDQQFPDTQYVTFEYPGDGDSHRQLLVYEHRIWSPYMQEEYENGNAFYGTDGYMILSKMGGWKLYGEKNQLIQEEAGEFTLAGHVADFLDAIRSDRRPNADIEIGHRSATLSHLANLIARTGRQGITLDPEKERIVDDPEVDALLGRDYQPGHWAVPKGAV